MGKPLKVAIVGTANSCENAPYDDYGWQIWGSNEVYQLIGVRRLDLLLDIHPRTTVDRHQAHVDWLQNADIPVLMLEHYEEYPTSEPFPIKKITERFGAYFTNSISYLLALAILRDADEISIYGVNMATDVEFTTQRPSCEYYIGLARGLGITVNVPDDSDMMKCPGLYGYDDAAFGRWFRGMEHSTTRALELIQKAACQIIVSTAVADMHQRKMGGIVRRDETEANEDY